jgi:nitrate reductase NapD
MKPLETEPSGTSVSAEGAIHLSGVLVRVQPADLERVAAALDDLPDVEVHHRDGPAGKLVITLESTSREGTEEAVRRIQLMPAVLLADPVYHYVDRADTGDDSNPNSGGCI